MKVHVVLAQDYDVTRVVGVFTDEALALKVRDEVDALPYERASYVSGEVDGEAELEPSLGTASPESRWKLGW